MQVDRSGNERQDKQYCLPIYSRDFEGSGSLLKHYISYEYTTNSRETSR